MKKIRDEWWKTVHETTKVRLYPTTKNQPLISNHLRKRMRRSPPNKAKGNHRSKIPKSIRFSGKSSRAKVGTVELCLKIFSKHNSYNWYDRPHRPNHIASNWMRLIKPWKR